MFTRHAQSATVLIARSVSHQRTSGASDVQSLIRAVKLHTFVQLALGVLRTACACAMAVADQELLDMLH